MSGEIWKLETTISVWVWFSKTLKRKITNQSTRQILSNMNNESMCILFWGCRHFFLLPLYWNCKFVYHIWAWVLLCLNSTSSSRAFALQSLGGCNRCQMINMTSSSGEVHRSNEPLATLASYRRVKVSQLPYVPIFAVLIVHHFHFCNFVVTGENMFRHTIKIRK